MKLIIEKKYFKILVFSIILIIIAILEINIWFPFLFVLYLIPISLIIKYLLSNYFFINSIILYIFLLIHRTLLYITWLWTVGGTHEITILNSCITLIHPLLFYVFIKISKIKFTNSSYIYFCLINFIVYSMYVIIVSLVDNFYSLDTLDFIKLKIYLVFVFYYSVIGLHGAYLLYLGKNNEKKL